MIYRFMRSEEMADVALAIDPDSFRWSGK